MAKYKVLFREVVSYDTDIVIEADSKEEAEEKLESMLAKTDDPGQLIDFGHPDVESSEFFIS